MKSLSMLVFVLIVFAFLLSCGGDGQEGAVLEADSMDEALALAGENDCAIAIEFWMDG